MSWEEDGPEREEEEELEWLSNKDAFLSVETMAPVEVEEAPAFDTPWARTKRRRHVTAKETTCRQASVRHGDFCAVKETTAMPTVHRCAHCGVEKTPEWRQGPEGPRTLCNACGIVFRKRGRLLPEYRPANSPAFSAQLHSSTYSRALEMHRRKETSATAVACHGEVRCELTEAQLLPPANGPASSSPLQRYSSLFQSEHETIAAIRATAETRSAERAAAFLAAMDI
jgi:hypothetical protein